MKRIVTINRVHVQGTCTPQVHAHAGRTHPNTGDKLFLVAPEPGILEKDNDASGRYTLLVVLRGNICTFGVHTRILSGKKHI